MHIKQVIISGFRSFRAQNEIEQFSPKHNVIVGRNGSGKSNFFDAIQFVLLAPKFATLRQEDRQHLLHEGAGSSVMAAYVEIVFDNSDCRFSIEADEVVLRRTVGLKKDEYFLNRKRVQKSEVQSLLESAGFSKSNPYYIVQQGKVSHLCIMKDRDRLDLLKEIAGTTVYEERRAESLQIIQDANGKQERIVEVLAFIEERLTELEQEKKELTEYDQLDKSRRAIEFTLYDNELTKAQDKLAQLEITRETERNKQTELQDAHSELQESRVVKEEEAYAASAALQRLRSRLQEKSGELSNATTSRNNLLADLEDAAMSAAQLREEKIQVTQALQTVMEQISVCEQELKRISPEYDQKNMALEEAKSESERVHARVEMLFGRQGRGRQFTSKADRDAFLQGQINSLRSQVRANEALLEQMKAELSLQDQRRHREQADIKDAETQLKAQRIRADDLSRSIRDKLQVRNDLQEKRKESWKENDLLQERIAEAKKDLEKGRQQLNAALPKAISIGLSTVEQLVEELHITGYYGPLIDNFSLKNDAFQAAVEVAAGNSLFSVVVDTDETAARLINELESRKAGRLSFLPLNRLRVPQVTYPDSKDVRPLLDVAMSYTPEVEAAMRQVFGKKLLARDLAVAAHFSADYDLDAITKEGDLVNRRGGFEGGFRDEKLSRIAAVRRIREATESLAHLETQEKDITLRLEILESAVNSASNDLHRLELERDRLKPLVEVAQKEISEQLARHVQTGKMISAKQNDITELQGEVQLTEAQIEAFESERQTPLMAQLTDTERAELKRSMERERELQPLLDQLEAEFLQVAQRQGSLRADLRDNLLLRQEELQNRLTVLASVNTEIESSQTSSTDQETEELAARREYLDRTIAALKDDVDAAETDLEERTKAFSILNRELDGMRTEEDRLTEELKEAASRQDKLLNKRSLLIEAVHTRQRQVRDLGALPRRELASFQHKSERQLLEALKKVNERLKTFGNVNKKALDQYVSFSQHRDTLITRRDELTKDNVAIAKLVESLDAQKDEAILRTFRGVSQHFAQVFSELVPQGRGQLVMRSSLDGSGEDSDQEEFVLEGEASDVNVDEADVDQREDLTDSAKKKIKSGSTLASTKITGKSISKSDSSKKREHISRSVSTFVGVQVRVSFSGAGQLRNMQQLSGGQKALVALALIFAIQRCDPAPFYLFDEVDQALDANYRKSVAALIQRQTESTDSPAQFITTTFRSEMVSVGTKFYGIALMNKVSNIYPLEKADAQNFVSNLLSEDEAVGRVSAVPVYDKRRILQEGDEDDESNKGEGDDDDAADYDDNDDDVVAGLKRTAKGTRKKPPQLPSRHPSTQAAPRYRRKSKTQEPDSEDEEELGEEDEALIEEHLADLAALDLQAEGLHRGVDRDEKSRGTLSEVAAKQSETSRKRRTTRV